MHNSIRINILDSSNFQGVLGVVGLPRSGTTICSSVIGAHSTIYVEFEPWNNESHRLKIQNLPRDTINTNLGLTEFLHHFSVSPPEESSWIAIKETTTKEYYIEGVVNLLKNTEKNIHAELFWVMRNPFHVYLSDVEARKKYWGVESSAISLDNFDQWARRTITGFNKLIWGCKLSSSFKIFSYHRFIESPDEILTKLFSACELNYEPAQLEYVGRVNSKRVRGDFRVAHTPEGISDKFDAKREGQVESLLEVVKDSRHLESINQMKLISDAISEGGVSADENIFSKSPFDYFPRP